MMFSRPEKQTDPDKLPGQIVNRSPEAVFLRDYIAMVKDEESGCRCTKPAEPCEGCPYATV